MGQLARMQTWTLFSTKEAFFYLRLFGPVQIWLSLTVDVQIVQIFLTNDKETTIFERIFMIDYLIFELGCSNSEKSVTMRSKQQAFTHVMKRTRTFS